MRLKGRCQKLLSGFFPLRGGGYPPFPLRVFGQDDFPLRGVPPNSPEENSAKKQFFLGLKTLFFAFFHTFLALFGLLYGLFGPFLTLFNTKTSFLDLLGKQISGKA